jgi:hypothetical protein
MPRHDRGTTSFAQTVQTTPPIDGTRPAISGATGTANSEGSITALARGTDALQAQIDSMADLPTVEDLLAGGGVPAPSAPMAPATPAININLGQGGSSPAAPGGDISSLISQLIQFDPNTLRTGVGSTGIVDGPSPEQVAPDSRQLDEVPQVDIPGGSFDPIGGMPDPVSSQPIAPLPTRPGQPAPQVPARPPMQAPPDMDLSNREDPRVLDFLRRQSPDRAIAGGSRPVLTPEQEQQNADARKSHDEQTIEIFGTEGGGRMIATRQKLEQINELLRDGKLSMNDANKMRRLAHGIVDQGLSPGGEAPAPPVGLALAPPPAMGLDASQQQAQQAAEQQLAQQVLPRQLPQQAQGGVLNQAQQAQQQAQQQLLRRLANEGDMLARRNLDAQTPTPVRRSLQAGGGAKVPNPSLPNAGMTTQDIMMSLRNITNNRNSPNRRRQAINFLRSVEAAGGVIPPGVKQRLTRRQLPKSVAQARLEAGTPREARRNSKAIRRRTRLDRIRARRRGRRR